MPETHSDAVTLQEAARILGCSVTTVRRQIASGRLIAPQRYRHRQLSRTDVEDLALEVFRWKRHRLDV